MNDRGIQVLEQYDLDVKRVIKGRGAMLAECSEGYYRLLEYTGSAARLIYESELLSYIIGHGFPLVSNILRNKENALFSADSAGIRYILVQHYQGAECDVRNREDINRAARTMAALHKVLDSVKIKDAQYIPELPDQLDEMRRHNTELKRIRSYMREKTRKTEFEYAVLARFEWEKDLKTRKTEALKEARVTYAEDIAFYKMLQYLFFKQWWDLKAYVNDLGIEIIGDVPIYVAGDSADVWADPGQFYLDEELNPIDVAGCPPDAFSADGQLWGNPLFRWDAMKKDGYSWWTKRVKAMSKLYDIVRIDHFRGFDSYYAIPAKDDTARNGECRKGPGMDLFRTMEKKLGKLNIIVEDLGFLTPSVLKLVKDSGFPGMKVIQFAFDSREGSDYLPHNYEKHCVVYTGTHDNDTLMGWMKTAPKASVKFAKEYLNLTEEEGFNWGMMRAAWASVGDMAIVPMQDLIGIGSEGRMNTPSTLGGNWEWRATSDQITGKLAKRLYKYMEMYGRLNKDQEEEEETEAEEKKVSAEEK